MGGAAPGGAATIFVLRDDEKGRREWLEGQPGGFPSNHFGCSDPAMNVLHKAACVHLRRTHDRGRRIAVPKVCSTAQSERLERINHDCGPKGWTQCAACGGWGGDHRGAPATGALLPRQRSRAPIDRRSRSRARSSVNCQAAGISSTVPAPRALAVHA